MDFGTDESGKRHRPYWYTEHEADQAIENFKKRAGKGDDWWPKLSRLEKQTIATTCMQIKAAGYTLPRVWEEHQKWRAERAQKPRVEEKAYEDAVKEFRKRKLEAGKSERYVDEVVDILNGFGKGRERVSINRILPEDLNVYINGKWDNMP